MLAIYFSSNMYFKMINKFDSTRKKKSKPGVLSDL